MISLPIGEGLFLDHHSAIIITRCPVIMADVKNLIQVCLKIWYVVIIALLGLWFWSWRKNWSSIYWKWVARGGLLTIGVIIAVLLGVAINFDALFRGFHAIFFTGDTWLFYTSDSLIRLFPEKLWSDAFLFMGIFTLTGAIVLGFLGLRLSQRKISA